MIINPIIIFVLAVLFVDIRGASVGSVGAVKMSKPKTKLKLKLCFSFSFNHHHYHGHYHTTTKMATWQLMYTDDSRSRKLAPNTKKQSRNNKGHLGITTTHPKKSFRKKAGPGLAVILPISIFPVSVPTTATTPEEKKNTNRGFFPFASLS
jgi:hypothetical protein